MIDEGLEGHSFDETKKTIGEGKFHDNAQHYLRISSEGAEQLTELPELKDTSHAWTRLPIFLPLSSSSL